MHQSGAHDEVLMAEAQSGIDHLKEFNGTHKLTPAKPCIAKQIDCNTLCYSASFISVLIGVDACLWKA